VPSSNNIKAKTARPIKLSAKWRTPTVRSDGEVALASQRRLL
jgi:hypothetical protein